MKKSSNKTVSIFLQRYIEKFENKILNEKETSQYSGIVYTPSKVADFIVRNIFKIYIEDYLENFDVESNDMFLKGFNPKTLQAFLGKNPKLKRKLAERIKSLKILDPACGSGRFLISTANLLLKIYKILDIGLNEYDSKRFIIENVLYGIEIEKTASTISKVRLISWLLSNDEEISKVDSSKFSNASLEDLSRIYEDFNVSFNIFNLDFLLDFDINGFDIIIGNPPYVENKKIEDNDYKKKLKKNFKSAYRLFDLSIVFVEKSLSVLKENEGYLSFLTTNKFLSADYGIKIRKLLVNNTELKELINVSSLKVFNNIAAYPIIITFKKTLPNIKNQVIIKQINKLEDLFNLNNVISESYPQEFIKKMPNNVIPISGDLNLVQYLYAHFKPMAESIIDLKIIYRPFGFLNWAKYFNNLSENKNSDNDMLLLGTGNVGKYHIKFNKRIKIAKKDIPISYFKHNQELEDIFIELQCEKLIFREIAKDLTVVYDSGIFTNITGLYFIKIPSYDTSKLFCLLAILNSRLMDSVFKTLFGTLHMASGYLRFNGSFIKRLPMPEKFPEALSYLGKINQFLCQILYEQDNLLFNFQEITKYHNFFLNLSNSLVSLLYLKDHLDKPQFTNLMKLLTRPQKIFPDIEFKFISPRFNLPKFKIYSKKELQLNLQLIKKSYKSLNNDKTLINEINKLTKQKIYFNSKISNSSLLK